MIVTTAALRREAELLSWNSGRAGRPGPRRRLAGALLLVVATGLGAGPRTAQAAVPQGVWIIDGKAAVEIYDCAGLLSRLLDESRLEPGCPRQKCFGRMHAEQPCFASYATLCGSVLTPEGNAQAYFSLARGSAMATIHGDTKRL